MNPKEAYKIVLSKIPGLTAVSCIDYGEVFVFDMQKKGEKEVVLDNLFSVNKKTGELRNFKPFSIPIDKYKNGKKVLGYK